MRANMLRLKRNGTPAFVGGGNSLSRAGIFAVLVRKESDTGPKRNRGRGFNEQISSFGLHRRRNPWFGGIGLGGRSTCRRDSCDAPCRERQGCQDGPDG